MRKMRKMEPGKQHKVGFYRFEESKTLQLENLVFHTPVANM